MYVIISIFFEVDTFINHFNNLSSRYFFFTTIMRVFKSVLRTAILCENHDNYFQVIFRRKIFCIFLCCDCSRFDGAVNRVFKKIVILLFLCPIPWPAIKRPHAQEAVDWEKNNNFSGTPCYFMLLYTHTHTQHPHPLI